LFSNPPLSEPDVSRPAISPNVRAEEGRRLGEGPRFEEFLDNGKIRDDPSRNSMEKSKGSSLTREDQGEQDEQQLRRGPASAGAAATVL